MKTRISFLSLMLSVSLTCFSQWTQLGSTLEGITDESGLWFGYDVALSADGTTMAAGAPFNTGVGLHQNNSYVEIYRYNNGDWQLLGNKIEGADHFIQSRITPHAGWSIAMSHDGNIVAIGEPLYYTVFEDQLTPQNGRVRVFQYTNGDWEQVGDDIISGLLVDNNGNYSFEPGHHYFGDSVELSADGSVLVIGDYDAKDSNGVRTGEVRVYHNINNTWQQRGSSLYGEINMERFGYSVDISADGNIIAVGAPTGQGGGLSPNPGYVDIYEYQNNNWQLIGNISGLYSSAWGNGNWAGWSVALSADGTIVALGGTQYNNGTSTTGNVRVFKNQSGNWEQLGDNLQGSFSYGYYGDAISLSHDGTILAVGESGNSAKRVHVFQYDAGIWTLVDELVTGTVDERTFGKSVSLSADGSVLALGAPGTRISGVNDVGVAKVYLNCNLANISVLPEATPSFCEGEIVNLEVSIEQLYYQERGLINWYENVDDVTPVFNGTTYETPEIHNTISYWVEAITSTGCPSERIEITINPNEKDAPFTLFNYPEAICTTETSAMPILSQDFNAGGQFYTTSNLIVNPSTGAVNASNSEPGTYTIIYEIGENQENCMAAGVYETQIIVQTCHIQRGISPNGDGVNDYFDLSGHSVKKLSIYNRYGAELYSKTDYVNEWGGNDKNGNKLPTGTYFYSIEKYNGEQLSGWIYINREQ